LTLKLLILMAESRLGLEVQKRDIRLYLDNYNTTPYKVLEEFLEIDSGANSARTTLNDAISLAKKHNATLLVAKLDRLSRKVSFIASLMEDRKLNFKVATMPHADPFQLHIYAALAEQEREFIVNVQNVLAEAKVRSTSLEGFRTKLNNVAYPNVTMLINLLKAYGLSLNR
jgi:DNA invertase Pin-like site-specific DNA recombinase